MNDCNKININTLMTYIQSGDISLEDLPNLSPERRQEIEKRLNEMPNSFEQKEWADIHTLLERQEYSQSLLDMISNYIRRWEGKRPSGNHVDEANQCYFLVERKLQEITANVEQADWDAVDVFSKDSLLGHLAKYPNTSHRDEIDETVWGLTNKDQVADIQEYLDIFSNGKFAKEAQAMLNGIVDWENVKITGDIFIVNDYIHNNPNSPFLQQAKIELMKLKQGEISLMRNEPNKYEVERLVKLINEKVINKDELIKAGVMTENVWETLMTTDITYDLPDIKKAMETSTPECKEGYTDVYFFGVPSTGKTCVLMGLSRSSSLNINLAHGGGDYAAALQQYTDVGLTVPRTEKTFVTTLEATIRSSTSAGAKHNVNLVEMSGEEFAFGIANNPDKVYTFEDMGTGATKLLNNDNRKVFFLIIDPTTNVVHITREVVTGYDEETGKAIIELEHCAVNQRILIQKMVNLLQNPGNAEIMEKVDSIHIIVTKADTLGDPVQREQEALRIFRNKYQDDILDALIEICEEHNINVAQGYHPNLYTFSLGQFYVGGLYEYDNTDSDKLVRAIRNSTQMLKKKTFWDKVKDAVN
ncbi:MAG: hypothetical protein IKW85_04790 [Muribaculaceae bacterium]|nr:hypothetical protein [Muribaculaceae bacterium]